MWIGIDLGGTKIEGVVLDANGLARQRERIETPSEGGYDAILHAIAALVTRLEVESGTVCTVGVGSPGAVSTRTGLMKNCNTTALNGRPLPDDLSRALGREVRLENDANCFALAEAHGGAAEGRGVVFGVILGTGVGGGVVVRGKLHTGPNRIAGEWGHVVLDPSGPECYCGRRGCVETFLSGPAFARDYLRRGGETGLTAKQIHARAHEDDELARAALTHYLDCFGRGLAAVINTLDPDIIVLGGGLSAMKELYREGIASVARHVFGGELRTPIVQNLHGDASGVLGAARLWPI